MDINSDEGSQGAAVQVWQRPSDQAGESSQLGSTGQQVLGKGSRGAWGRQALLHSRAPVNLGHACNAADKWQKGALHTLQGLKLQRSRSRMQQKRSAEEGWHVF